MTNVPRSRVQHTDVSQGPLERNHGLGTLVVYTAGTDHAKVELGGLDHRWRCASASTCSPASRPMASEQRLHPASMLFAVAGSLKTFALPGLLRALHGWPIVVGSGARAATGKPGCCSC